MHDLPGLGDLVPVDQDAPGDHAAEAFQHAHVIVDDHVHDAGTLEEVFDHRDQDDVVGSDEFFHAAL